MNYNDRVHISENEILQSDSQKVRLQELVDDVDGDTWGLSYKLFNRKIVALKSRWTELGGYYSLRIPFGFLAKARKEPRITHVSL